MSGTAAVRGSCCGCSRRKKSASQGWRQGERWFSRRGGEVAGGSRRREPSLRKEHGRKRLGKCAADAGVEERAGKGASPYSLSLQRGGRSFCEMWEKGLRF